ncbi:MAG TPA: hypothetical protein ENL43_04040, partial [candidate division WOR-3 bacterium]|nr:hypothetical protein [candidate division WOR-3 bacterium]
LTEFNGKKVLDLKNTFNTTETFKPGDIISVEIEDIWRHETPKGIYYSIHKPKIRHITEKKETTPLSELDNLVCSIGSKVVEEQEVIIERNSKLPKESVDDTEDSEGGTRSEAAKKFFEENWHNLYPKSGKGEWVYHCLGGETPIILQDKKTSEIRIEQISWLTDTKVNNYKIWNGEEFVNILGFKINQKQQVLHIETDSGYVRCSPDHRFFINNKAVFAYQLKAGDILDTVNFPQLPEVININPEWAWLLGFFAAEGYATYYASPWCKDKDYQYGWQLVNTDEKLINKAEQILNSFGVLTQRFTRYNQSHNTLYCLRIRNEESLWARMFSKWFYVKQRINKEGYKTNKFKKIPDFIFIADNKAKKAFLDGFYAGDGVKAKKGRKGYQGFSNISPLLTQGILLLEANVKYQSRHFSLCVSEPTKNRHRVYRVTYCQSFINLKKPQNSHRKAISGRIKCITQGNEETLFDIAVEGEKFMAGPGNILSHNCHWRGLSEQEAKTLDHKGLLMQGTHSVHGDLRLSNNGTLHGFTVFEGSAKDIPVKEGSKLIYMAQHKGETKFEKLEVAPKLLQPRSWLLVGRDKPYLSPPKGIGSTTNKWAKFFALDWGTYELGVIREHSRE